MTLIIIAFIILGVLSTWFTWRFIPLWSSKNSLKAEYWIDPGIDWFQRYLFFPGFLIWPLAFPILYIWTAYKIRNKTVSIGDPMLWLSKEILTPKENVKQVEK